MSGTFDVFLVLHPFRDNVREFQILVGPLADLETIHLQDAEGFYAPRIDTAILGMHFTPRAVEHLGQRMLLVLAGRSGLPMIVPSRLSRSERHRFFLEHLSGYDTYVQQYRDPRESMSMVARVLRCLSEHIANRRLATAGRFDVNQLPVVNPKKRQRMASASIV